MQNQKHEVHLSDQERKKLIAIVSKGRNKAAVIRRAHILLKTDEGKTDVEISECLYISEQTVRRTRIRYCEDSLQDALDDKPHPQPELKLDEEKEAYLIALACSTPPAGRKRWTLELLAKQLVDDGIVEHIVPETVRLMLKKTVSSLGK
jgi:transposase